MLRLGDKQVDKLSGAQKSAILLVCLGEEATAKIFEHLADSEVQAISRCMMEIEHVPKNILMDVLKEYEVVGREDSGVFVDGDVFVKKVLQASSDRKRAEALMEQFSNVGNDDPMGTIANMAPNTVAGLIGSEHPQTIALILSTQKNEHTARILDNFPEDLRGEILYRIAKIEKVSPEIIAQIEMALRHEIGGVVVNEYQKVGGVDKVVEILGKMKKGADEAVLESIEESDTEMAEEIRKRMFTFEDLLDLDKRALQKILREINSDQLTVALKTASVELKLAIFANISQRAAAMIEEDLEAMGPVKLSDVEAAQIAIVKTAFKLQEEGQITLPGRGGDDVLV
jgi:flagellar motor switch protein FliG